MYIVGITGGIASGKSTVARQLRSLGMQVIDADELARQVVEPGRPAWKEIVDNFGPEYLNEDQTINRLRLGKLVFSNPELLKKLNSATHPHILNEFKNRIREIRANHHQAIIGLEVPLLYETNMNKLCDQVWVVWVDYQTQLERLMARDGISREDAEKRIAAQMPLNEKAKRAQLVIDNRYSPEHTSQQVKRYFNAIRQAAE